MMKRLTHLPDDVVGVTASGQIDANDYETVLTPAVQSALEKHDRIRVLYHLAPDFTGFTPGAMWDDARLGAAHMKAWERIAVVTDAAWVANATRMFAFLMPSMVKVFANKELAEAERWLLS